jgi:hypothetical protein
MSQGQLQANAKNNDNNKNFGLMQKVKDPPVETWTGPLSVPVVRGSKISKQSLHEGGKVVSLTHRPSLPTGIVPGTHFC